jgi:hypothetical protein
MGKYYYPQFIIPYAYAYSVAEALSELSGNEGVKMAKMSVEGDAAAREKKRIEELERKLGYKR